MSDTMADSLKSEHQFSDEAFYTELGIKYDAAYGHDVALRKVTAAFISMLPNHPRVLECGPGTGIVAEVLVDGGCHLLGIDMSEGMVELCRKRVPGATFQLANMLEYDASKEHYDGIVASLSIFEISRQEVTTMTEKWSQWIKPGGFLMIATLDPKAGEPGESYQPKTYDPDGECATEVPGKFMGRRVLCTLFTKEGWKKLLGNVGFEIVHTEADSFQAKAYCDPEPRYYIIAKKTGNV